MKKVLSIVLSIAIVATLFSGIATTVIAGNDPTITVESIEASAGDTVDVEVSIENNPGIAYLELTPQVAEGLTITKVTNGDILADLTKGKQYVLTSDEDSTANGTLLTLTIKVSETATYGDYSVGMIFRSAVNYNEETVTFKTVDGKITYKNPQPETKPEETDPTGSTDPTEPEDDSPTITMGSAKCKEGETVTVDVNITNNPGVSYIELSPEVTKGLSISSVDGKFLFSDFTKGKQYVWVADEDVTEDGKLATITFKVEDKVCSGDYAIGFTLRGIYNYNEEPVAFKLVSGKITVEGEDNFKAANVNVGSSLTMNTEVEVPASVTSPKMKCTIDGKEKIIDGTYSNGKWNFKNENILPQNMSDKISMQLMDGNKVISTKESCVKDYCDTLYKTSAADLKISEAKKEKMVTFLADMLEYGAAMQKYVGHHTSNLPNTLSWVSDSKTSSFVKPNSDKRTTISATSADDKLLSATLVLDSYIELVVFANIKNATTLEIKQGEVTYTMGVNEAQKVGSYYVFNVKKLSATQLDQKFQITLRNDTTDLHQVYYSVNSYVASKCGDNDSKLAELVKSIYKYGESAQAYNKED